MDDTPRYDVGWRFVRDSAFTSSEICPIDSEVPELWFSSSCSPGIECKDSRSGLSIDNVEAFVPTEGTLAGESWGWANWDPSRVIKAKSSSLDKWAILSGVVSGNSLANVLR
jgi:hypothetical protein